MFQHAHPDLVRLLVAERHEALRREAGAARLRREARLGRATRRRGRPPGPER